MLYVLFPVPMLLMVLDKQVRSSVLSLTLEVEEEPGSKPRKYAPLKQHPIESLVPSPFAKIKTLVINESSNWNRETLPNPFEVTKDTINSTVIEYEVYSKQRHCMI